MILALMIYLLIGLVIAAVFWMDDSFLMRYSLLRIGWLFILFYPIWEIARKKGSACIFSTTTNSRKTYTVTRAKPLTITARFGNVTRAVKPNANPGRITHQRL